MTLLDDGIVSTKPSIGTTGRLGRNAVGHVYHDLQRIMIFNRSIRATEPPLIRAYLR